MYTNYVIILKEHSATTPVAHHAHVRQIKQLIHKHRIKLRVQLAFLNHIVQ
jgi:hypothetical protein